MPNYRRYYLAGSPVFVTFVTRYRKPWLAHDGCARLLQESMRRVKVIRPYKHLAIAILPDHVHWILTPGVPSDLGSIIASVKRDTTWSMKNRGQATSLWQARFWDHVIRDEEDLRRHLDYVHFNPVKHGLVLRAADYPHSSFTAWVQRGAYSVDWGSIEEPPDAVRGMELE